MTMTPSHAFKVGDLIEVEWFPDDDVEAGSFEGRIVAVKGAVLTVHFEYTDGTPGEDIRINIDDLVDLTNNKVVAFVAGVIKGRRPRSR